jgi:transposase
MLSIEKYTTTKIARLLKINRTTLPIWIRNWNKYKEVGLLEGHRSGRKNKLSEVSKDKLYDIIESGPIAYGFNSGIWTSVIISEVIKNDFNIDYHPGHVRKLLKRIGFSVQRPNYHLKRGDPEKKSKWRRYSHPNLKKKPLQKERS